MRDVSTISDVKAISFTPDEIRLVQAFRGTDFEDKSFILGYVERMAANRSAEKSRNC